MSAGRLFEPLKVGHSQLKHRMAMAPLTRFRADENHIPQAPMKLYYEQRASSPGTLLVTEATFISPRATGYAHVPGIWNDKQITAWKEIVDAVHAKDSFIYLQLWALGRVAGEGKNPENLARNGHEVMSSSDLLISPKHKKPKIMTEEDINAFVEDYANAARNALKAGFDGVEIHAANGYLIDQFTQPQANTRTDAYGGSVASRSRFCLEVTRAVIAACGHDSQKVGIRLSPWFEGQGLSPTDPHPQFLHLINELKPLNLAYLHLVEPRIGGKTAIDAEYTAETVTRQNDRFIECWGTTAPVLLAGGFDAAKAKAVMRDVYTAENVAVAFGRYFISTPDLPFRIQRGIELEPYDRKTFYSKGEKGYTTYPFSREWEAAQSKL